ncbi:hypothetical protein [Archangium lansingense]|uniref:Uncharacterized protein n=1 Tax=Archangium lansingense TaxID=2995310 RepID=A0ABT4A8X3_9BACT|nr:hypothetical protein [Archangium lansinium]MCY1077409.1 hypothetical protein [Archangium lansinium]
MARVRVSGVTGTMTPDLAREVLTELGRRAQPSERHDLRNALIRRAAEQLPGGLWEKAKRLEHEVKAARASRSAAADASSVRALVLQALEIDPGTPRGWRQLLRIIDPV